VSPSSLLPDWGPLIPHTVTFVDEATIRARVSDARVGRLATITPEGRPHIVPCCFALDGDVLYSAVDAKPKSTLLLRRLANVRANPAASLLIDHYEEDWSALWWVRVDGDGRIVEAGGERDRALRVLAAKYAQYRHQPPPGPVLAIDTKTWRAWP
jgi:PPOX class probable F420-dependent enzyme